MHNRECEKISSVTLQAPQLIFDSKKMKGEPTKLKVVSKLVNNFPTTFVLSKFFTVTSL